MVRIIYDKQNVFSITFRIGKVRIETQTLLSVSFVLNPYIFRRVTKNVCTMIENDL